MALISLKDYAAMNNVTYEAVRQQVVRYADELGNHIVKYGRQQFLDDEAIKFLDGKRQKNPVTIIQASKDEEIERLKIENENLQKVITSQANKMAEISEWKAEKALLIARAEQQTLFLEEKTKFAVAAAVQEAKIEAENEKQEAIRKAEDELKKKLQEEFNNQKSSMEQKHQEALEAEKSRKMTLSEAFRRVFGK